MASPSISTSALLYATVSNPSAVAAAPESAKGKKHHLQDGKGFVNPWDSWRDFSILQFLPEVLKRRFREKQPDTTPPTVPVRDPEFLKDRKTEKLRATWLGHACYFVEFPSGLRVLFDPVFSPRCSPFSWLGPMRYTKAPCKVEDIPIIDAVLISHSHYDHMDHPTLTGLLRKHPRAHFFVPLRNKQWFLDSKFPAEQVTELDWWEQRELTLAPRDDKTATVTAAATATDAGAAAPNRITATISCLPCQHSSGRTPFDRDRTLWASWGVASAPSTTAGVGPLQSVYFGGDTGYRAAPNPWQRPLTTADDDTKDRAGATCPAFGEIGAHLGPFDLGLIPIGAYGPRALFSPMHADPFDAVEIFRATRCRRAMGIHWGTWVLTSEAVLEPPRLLREALRQHELPEEGVFDTCEIGESREF